MKKSLNNRLSDVRHPKLRSVGSAGVLLACVLLFGACSSDAAPEVQAQSFDDASETGSAQIEAADDTTDSTESAATESGPAADDAPSSPAETAAEVGPILNNTGQGLDGAELEEYLASRYEAYWYAFDIARRAPSANPAADYPALGNLAAGDQLDQAYAELAELFNNGSAIRDPDAPAIAGLDQDTTFRVRIETLEDGVAELVSCLVNDQVTYNVADGTVTSDGVRTVQARATMAKADGTWKLIRSRAIGLEAGIAGCWLDEESDYPY